MKPRFRHPDNYDLHPSLEETRKQGKQIYRAMLEKVDPLAFWSGENWLEFGNDFFTDLGSTPAFVQGIPMFSKDRYEISYIFHDFICQHGYVWTSDGKKIYMTRAEADTLLAKLVEAEGALKGWAGSKWIASPIIWAGVRVGAWFGIGSRKKG